MGNGFTVKEARTVLTSLNRMFNADVAATRANYAHLKAVYPEFLMFTADTSDRRIWRKRTLRFAALLLTADIDFTTSAHPFPGKNFKRWLRWLTWLQVMPDPATVKIDNVVSADPPAKAIMDTLRMALEDAGGKVEFDWGELAAMSVEVQRATAPNYKIKVRSMKEQDIGGHHDNDEDDV